MANRVIQYLYGIRSRAIYYRGDKEGMNGRGRDKGIHNKGWDNRRDSRSKMQSFICASNASFTDNFVNKKSLQGYIIKLFRGPITWRANKQNTVIILNTEAKLLALLQTAKETIFINRLFKAMILRLDKPLIINCNNTQTF